MTLTWVGFIGTFLHVAAWLCAFGFDIARKNQINYDKAPGAHVFWLWGFIPLLIGLVVLLVATGTHACTRFKFAEGGAPPFLMTLFIGGAQISLIFTIVQMIANLGTTNTEYRWINLTLPEAEQEDEIANVRNVLVWAMLAKVYIVAFLKNNQAWAGPATVLRQSDNVTV